MIGLVNSQDLNWIENRRWNQFDNYGLQLYIVRGAFNKFPDYFVQAFKIVVDTWKFSMFLLYILWDD